MADQAGRAAEQARDKSGRAVEATRDKSKEVIQRGKSSAPRATKALGILAALALAGTVITVTVVGFIIASPFLLFFSPVLVPLGTLFVIGTGMFAVFCSAVSWLYQYMRGGHPPGSDKIDTVRRRIAESAHHLSEKTQGTGGDISRYLQDAAKAS
ncbi:oleosin 16 kDa [Selaginella moellendorffii]|nr:oleosin 16 kDa [Selaginella moellendorffii]|eukprot:XP_024526760.1 oleosin 16 kDa [Selaginella moellendorffii]